MATLAVTVVHNLHRAQSQISSTLTIKHEIKQMDVMITINLTYIALLVTRLQSALLKHMVKIVR